MNIRYKRFLHRAGRGAAFLLLPLFMQGCIKEIPTSFPTDYDWSPLIAFPIGEADFGLRVPYGFDTLLLEFDTSSGFPVWAMMETIPVVGSVDINFEEVSGASYEITLAVLRVNIYNGFPVDIEIQAYMEDEGNRVIDSLFIPTLTIRRGELEAGGKTSVAVHTQEEILFGPERIENLLQTKRITFRGEIKNVSYFPEYSFTVQLAGILGIIREF